MKVQIMNGTLRTAAQRGVSCRFARPNSLEYKRYPCFSNVFVRVVSSCRYFSLDQRVALMIFARKLHVLKGEVVLAGGDLQVHLYLATIRAI